MEEIIGHKKIINFFEQVQQNNSLSHAYCFVGQDSLGKKLVARNIIAGLFGVPLKKLDMNPDYLFLGREINEKTEKTKKNIDIEQIRELRSFFSLRSFSGRKCALIDNAHLMSSGAFNALLKTLEEPGEKNILFLITTDEKNLPETIVSRTQVLYFNPVKENELREYIEGKNIGLEKEKYIAFSAGVPGRLVRFLEEKEYFLWFEAEIQRFTELFFSPFFVKLESVEDLFGDKTDHISARENLQDILHIWLFVLREWLQIYSGKESVLQKPKKILPVEVFLSLEKKIYQAREELDENVHPRLLIENILLEIP